MFTVTSVFQDAFASVKKLVALRRDICPLFNEGSTYVLVKQMHLVFVDGKNIASSINILLNFIGDDKKGIV